MNTNDPLAPLRSLTYEQKEALIGIVWAATGTAAVLTRMFDSLGISFPKPVQVIIADVMAEAVSALDGDGDQ